MSNFTDKQEIANVLIRDILFFLANYAKENELEVYSEIKEAYRAADLYIDEDI